MLNSGWRMRGFTLPELVIALGIGSVLMLSAAQMYPLLRQRSQSLGRHYQLEQLLRNTLFTIEKDLRRAGFCNGECRGEYLTVGNKSGEAANSCVIVAYDLNRNGRWELPGSAEPEFFGYRLRQGGIEIQRGATSCEGTGWEKLLDPTEVNVTTFTVTRTQRPGYGDLFALKLSANWHKESAIHREVEIRVAGHAL